LAPLPVFRSGRYRPHCLEKSKTRKLSDKSRHVSAYFRMINDNGGVNGRKINFISYDDAYSPPKTVEQARKLVESDEVFLIFASLGTASNAAIQKYTS
jgi:ABC-type branched-subunit amino acid transport system substrate-binding protein